MAGAAAPFAISGGTLPSILPDGRHDDHLAGYRSGNCPVVASAVVQLPEENFAHDYHEYRVHDDQEALVAGSGAGPDADAVSDFDVSIRRDPEAGSAYHCHVPRTPASSKARNQLIAVTVLCLIFMVGEIVGGLLSNSLALVADATHLASDMTGFLISLVAVWLAKKNPTQRLNFGYYRAEVLGALFSVLIIWVMTGVLVHLAVRRIQNDTYHIEPVMMLITASLGVVFNIIMGCTLHSGLCKKCNVESKFGHGHSHGNGHGHSHGNGNGHSDGNSNGYSHGNGNGHRHGNGHCENAVSNNINRVTETQTVGGCALTQSSSPSHARNADQLSIPDEIPSGDGVTSARSYRNQRAPNGGGGHLAQLSHTGSMVGGNYVSFRDLAPADAAVVAPARSGGILEKIIGDPDANINIKAAMVHVIGDLVQSIGVLIAATIIYIDESRKIADPICTFVFAAIVLITTIPVMRDIFLILLEAVPRGTNFVGIAKDLHDVPGVRTAHSIQVWALTLDKLVICAHLAIDSGADWRKVVEDATLLLRKKHGAFHSTLQVEPITEEMASCAQCTYTSPGTVPPTDFAQIV